jgi:hypothetical protein
MARKPKTPKPHHTTHRKEKRTKRFLKVYAPYIPLLLIVGLGLFLSNFSDFKQRKDQTVLSYATNISDEGLLEAQISQELRIIFLFLRQIRCSTKLLKPKQTTWLNAIIGPIVLPKAKNRGTSSSRLDMDTTEQQKTWHMDLIQAN